MLFFEFFLIVFEKIFSPLKLAGNPATLYLFRMDLWRAESVAEVSLDKTAARPVRAIIVIVILADLITFD